MKTKTPNSLAWKESSKKTAAVAGILMLILAALAMKFGEHQLLPFWTYALPLLMAGFSFGMAGMIANQLSRSQDLQALPELDYPLTLLRLLTYVHMYIFLAITGIYFSALLNQGGIFYNIFHHWLNYMLVLIALFIVASGGGQVLLTKQEDGLVYRDTVSKSKLSRQDVFFSLCGYWRDGFIIGWKLFPFESMESIEEDKYALTIRGREEGQRFALVMYTPRIQKKAREKLLTLLKPY